MLNPKNWMCFGDNWKFKDKRGYRLCKMTPIKIVKISPSHKSALCSVHLREFEMDKVAIHE